MSHPFIPVPNVASCELIYSHAGEINENQFHVSKASPFSLADLQALRTAANNWDSATGSTGRISSASLTRIRTKALDTNSSPLEDFSLPTPRPGTLTGVALPLNSAFCVKLATGLAGRSFRGRWYWGNLTHLSMADAGHLSLASATAYSGFLTTLKANMLTAGFTLVVVSYRTGNAWRATGVATPILTAVAVDTALDSMRRRLPGRGHA
jgi:hypothetical protein